MPLRWRIVSTRSLSLIKNTRYTRPSPSLSMPISSKSRVRKPSEEIVDDSEPERAELRRRQPKSSAEPPALSHNSGARTAVLPSQQQPSRYIQISDVIEISDSDSEPSCSYSRVVSKDTRSHIEAPLRTPTNMPGSSVYEEEEPISATGGKLLSSSVLDNSTSTIPSKSKTPFIDAQRFAYVGRNAVKKTATLPPNSLDTAAPPPKRKNPTFDLPNVDLSKVSRCVCCELSWTVRKSGPQKLSHIRTCARKHAFTEETVLILLQKEVSGYVKPSKQTSETQGKKPASPVPGPSKKTYMEELTDIPARKKSKLKGPETRLANIALTRDSILARAQGVLNNPCSSSFETRTNDSPTNEFSQRPFNDHDNAPPFTQPFGQSGLAHAQGLAAKTSLFNFNASPERADFHNGEAAHRLIHTQQRSLDGASDLLGTQLFSNDLRMSQKDVRSHMAISENELSEISDHEDFENLTIGSKPTTRPRTPSRQTSLTRPSPKLTPEKRSKDSRLTSPRPSLDDAFARLTLEPTSKKTRRPAKPRTPKTAVRAKKIVFGPEWEAHMKMHILRDSELHHQVLRYQPIHFDVFLEYAKLYAPLSNKLKLQLQIFLDQQAILFFAGKTWKR